MVYVDSRSMTIGVGRFTVEENGPPGLGCRLAKNTCSGWASIAGCCRERLWMNRIGCCWYPTLTWYRTEPAGRGIPANNVPEPLTFDPVRSSYRRFDGSPEGKNCWASRPMYVRPEIGASTACGTDGRNAGTTPAAALALAGRAVTAAAAPAAAPRPNNTLRRDTPSRSVW